MKLIQEIKKGIWLLGEEREYTNRSDRINLKLRTENQRL